MKMIDNSSISDSFQPEYYLPNELQFMDSGASHWRLAMRSPTWRPPTDVFETEEAIIVRVEIAGMREIDFSIELDGRILTIRGMRSDSTERRAYHQMEIRFGEFSIEVEMPYPVEMDNIEAFYNNGFLRVSLPKARPRQISID